MIITSNNGKQYDSKALYLDWFNNFLTIERFADYYDITEKQALDLFDLHRQYYKLTHKG